MRRALALLVLIAAACSAAPAGAKSHIRLVKVGRFDQPLYVTAPPGDRHRVFVVQKAGKVIEVRDGKVLAEPFLDLSDRVRDFSEQGLLSIAFPPDYATSKLVYAFWSSRDAEEHIMEYRAATPDHADPATEREVLFEDDSEENNNGGQLQFGPDGYLYISNGDGGGSEGGPPDPHGERGNAQDLGSLFGKILRIDPRGGAAGAYSVPLDNPFQGAGQRPEIYLYGVRNPWRFSFDRATGALVVADVGRSAQEEVDYFPRGQGLGANLGWRVFEGTHRLTPGEDAPGAVAPVMTFNHGTDHFCAITGGYVARDRRVRATYGRYVFGDFCTGQLLASKLRRPRSTARRLGRRVPLLVSFGEDARGRVYAVSQRGPVYRIAAR